jgi:hypothetical protein
VLGNAVVKATFGKHSYDLQVHTLQAIALMEFNATKGEVHTYDHTYTVTVICACTHHSMIDITSALILNDLRLFAHFYRCYPLHM